MTRGAPRDSYNVVYSIMFLQGVGSLLPWNFFITASGYFTLRFHDSPYQDNFLNWFGISFNLTNLIVLALSATLLQSYLPAIRLRIMVPTFLNALVFIINATLVKVHDFSGSYMFNLTMILICISATCGAISQGGIFALVTHFPPKYTQAVMAGQGLAGLGVALSNYLIILANPNHIGYQNVVDRSAFVYFLIAVLVLFMCLLSYLVLEKLSFARYYIPYENSVIHDAKYQLIDVKDEMVDLKNGNSRSFQSTWYKFVSTFYTVKIPAIIILQTFLVTLSVFPSVVAHIKSSSTLLERTTTRFGDPKSSDLFVPMLFVFFNAFDYIGRIMAGFFQMKSQKCLLMISFLRLGYIVLFLLCNVVDDMGVTQSHAVFQSDVWPILFVTTLALSNGYISSIGMMMGSNVNDEQKKGLVGLIMVLFLSIGLMLGSLLSFAIRGALCKCNPF